MSELNVTDTGFTTIFIGLKNFRQSLAVDANFNRLLVNEIKNMLLNVPLITFFSLFAATLLSQEFKGRMLARAIFFLPVVLTSGVISYLDNGNYMLQLLGMAGSDAEANFSAFSSLDLEALLLQGGMPPSIVAYLTGAVDRIYQIVTSSGIQIIIFLAALQSISPSLYEAARIEGSTEYEMFWEITFPMISPYILINTIYTIIDSFYNNNVTSYIQDMAFNNFKFGVSSAMSWIYFLAIAVILIVVTGIISKRVFYQE
jgi:ABC-type sugar transport system permease subunit